ncbi:Juvenile hormone epoxide hydrolase-like protein 1, partial [Operophtera brumata]
MIDAKRYVAKVTTDPCSDCKVISVRRYVGSCTVAHAACPSQLNISASGYHGPSLLYIYVSRTPKLPDLDLQKWWGVDWYHLQAIQDLKQRLKNRRPLTKPLEGIQSEYGMNTTYLENILEYWTEKYDIKNRVELLNKFPHYKTRIQGLDIHFMRVKPRVEEGLKVLPLLMLHGWPSSSKEFDKVIPLLTSPKEGYDFVFEVIAADLPGYGFSEGATKPGLNPVQIGIIMRNLMMRIGYDKFYVQAGDWGSQCATHMTTVFPDHVLGVNKVRCQIGIIMRHLMMRIGYDKFYVQTCDWGSQCATHMTTVFPDQVLGVNKARCQIGIIMRHLMMRIGYDKFYVQAGDWGSQCATHMTTVFPDQVLGVNKARCQIAIIMRHLMMRIGYDKFYVQTCDWGSQCATHMATVFPGQLLLGSLYPSYVDPVHSNKTYPLKKWFKFFLRETGYFHLQATKPDTIAVACNKEQLDTPHGGLENLDLNDVLDTVTIMWMNSCAQEIAHLPDWILKDKFVNLVRSTTLDFGGHFAALQTPQVLVDDIFAA